MSRIDMDWGDGTWSKDMAEADAVIMARAAIEFSANSANGLHYSPGPTRVSPGFSRQVLRCPFYKTAKYPHAYRLTIFDDCSSPVPAANRGPDGERFLLERARGRVHSDHSQANVRRGLNPYVKQEGVSPSKLKCRPATAVAEAYKVKPLNEEEQRQYKNFLARKKMKLKHGDMEKGFEHTWGGVEHVLQKG